MLRTYIFAYPLSFQMFDQLHNKGETSFNLKLSHSCDTCYNVRLLKVNPIGMLYLERIVAPRHHVVDQNTESLNA